MVESQPKKRRRWLGWVLPLPLTVAVWLIVDLAIARRYYTIGLFYRAASAWQCRGSDILSCNPASKAISPVQGRRGMVVTAQHEASAVGRQVLAQGGNAVDAAVAVGYALAVTHPCCGNLGGGGFMVAHFANGDSTFIDFRETAPLDATPDLYLDEQGEVIPGLSRSGYLAVGVPGTVKGLDHALTQYGTWSRQEVMAPAIQLAREGFILKPGDVSILRRGTQKFQQHPNSAQIFLREENEPYQAGDRLVQTELAQTLEQISQSGTAAFYRGAIASELVQASRQHGGILSHQDLETYEVVEQPPLRCTYRGLDVLTTAPPGGGTTLCQMLTIVDGYDLAELDHQSPEQLHRLLSTMLFAYRDRNTYLGDPAFVDNPVARLLSADYGAWVRDQIGDRAIPPAEIGVGVWESEGENTTHYSILDRQGNAVSVTTTINGFFGAGVIAGKTGFFLNNEMDDFTVKPGVPNSFGLLQGEANAIEPGKRPLSSMAPTILLRENQVYLVIGTPGGSTIPTSILQVISGIVDHDLPLEAAVSNPRFHYQGWPDVVFTEPGGLTAATVGQLRRRGYRVMPFRSQGAVEAILVDGEQAPLGLNDPRRPAGQAMSLP